MSQHLLLIPHYATPQYVVSTVRAPGVEVNNFRPLSSMLEQLGMPLYGCLTPDGYKNTQNAWLNPDAMTRRLSFATALASGRLRLDQSPTKTAMVNPSLTKADTPPSDHPFTLPLGNLSKPQPVDALQLANTLGIHFSAQTESAIASSPQLRAALILGSPEFMHR